ncbi:MAG: hypothetical protein IPO92_05720 [Saprospiraceae bacterium]|nr:hypothetical protein [Saprospiraceae bacterium]
MRDENAAGVKQKSVLKKIFRILKIVLIFIIVVLITILLLFQTKGVQNYARKEIVSFLKKTWKQKLAFVI